MCVAVGIARVVDETTHRALPRGINDFEHRACVENHEVRVLLLGIHFLPPLIHAPIEDLTHVLDHKRSLRDVLHGVQRPASLVYLPHFCSHVLTSLEPLVLARVAARAEARSTLHVDLTEGTRLVGAGNFPLDGQAVADSDVVNAELGVHAMQVGVPPQHHKGDWIHSSSCPPRPLQVLLVLLRKPLGIVSLNHRTLSVLDHSKAEVAVSERDGRVG
mmetsp:Transcript_2392/g.5673  ORF Transcript_2392/g.5673 Transcript_2392/m.5673 type:complete len:217 (+) Transcript_2392:2334-2984(+)